MSPLSMLPLLFCSVLLFPGCGREDAALALKREDR